jgi:hypothetical protein
VPAPPTLPCEPVWTTPERVDCLCPDNANTNGPCAAPGDPPVPASYGWTTAEIIRVASRILFLKTCRRFPGECVVELRPCDPCRVCNSCCTCDYHFIPLSGPYPVIDIAEVKIGGVTIPDTEYRVDEYSRLVRLGDMGNWPRSQNLDHDPDDPAYDDTFVVRYVVGRSVPEDLEYAAALLTCELKRACAGQTCNLPDRVTSVVRDGVSFDLIDPAEIAMGSSFGVPMIDAILKQYPCGDARQYRFTSRLMHPLLDGERYDRSGVRG